MINGAIVITLAVMALLILKLYYEEKEYCKSDGTITDYHEVQVSMNDSHLYYPVVTIDNSIESLTSSCSQSSIPKIGCKVKIIYKEGSEECEILERRYRFREIYLMLVILALEVLIKYLFWKLKTGV